MKNYLITFLLFVCFVPFKSLAQKMDHYGEWKLTSQVIRASDGLVYAKDSTTVFSRKILTENTFAVVTELRAQDGKKYVSQIKGGHYTLLDSAYVEKIEYANFKNYETLKVNFVLNIENGKMHQFGTVEDANGTKTVYDEWYEKVK